jgi:glycosyltransferase involved in cell wall biosynthesis
MSASIIPLVPNTQTNREWIINNKNGFMYKQNNAKDLTIKLSEILSLNSNQRKDITSVALETVKKRANWKLNSHKFLNFIEEPV